MEYGVSEFQSCVVIRFSGNLTGESRTGRIRDELNELIEAGKKEIVADLSEVQFMDSGGLGMLISGLTSMRNAGGDLRIAGADQSIIRLLTVTKLFTVFKTFPTLEEAVKSYQNQKNRDDTQ